MIQETYQRPNMSHFQESPGWDSLISTAKLVQKFLPKQADIDKLLKVIQRKGLHLSVTVKELQAGCIISPYFKDLYLYLAQNKLPKTQRHQFARWNH